MRVRVRVQVGWKGMQEESAQRSRAAGGAFGQKRPSVDKARHRRSARAHRPPSANPLAAGGQPWGAFAGADARGVPPTLPICPRRAVAIRALAREPWSDALVKRSEAGPRPHHRRATRPPRRRGGRGGCESKEEYAGAITCALHRPVGELQPDTAGQAP